jgi:hypothetical protein
MAYSKAKLKSSGDKVALFKDHFWKGKFSYKYLPTQTSLYVSFKHILIA